MRLFFLAIIVALLAGVVLFRLSDAVISIADNSILDTELTTYQAEASNSSASASITITTTGALNE